MDPVRAMPSMRGRESISNSVESGRRNLSPDRGWRDCSQRMAVRSGKSPMRPGQQVWVRHRLAWR